MSNVEKLGTCYYRDGYIFECLCEEYFSKILRTVADAPNVHVAVHQLSDAVVNDRPLCRVWAAPWRR